MTVAAPVQTRPIRVNLSGQRALVTGAGRGIGRGIALGLAESGADVAVVARTASEIERTAAEIRSLGRTSLARTCDIRDSAAIEPAVAEVWDSLGGVDILVNCAGVSPTYKRAERTSASEWDTILETNLRGTFLITTAIARRWLAEPRPGNVVTISSVCAAVAFPRLVAYNASKAGVESLTKTMALEWAANRIRVNAIGPAFVETELTAGVRQNPAVYDALIEKTPMGRLATVDEVVGTALYLVSDAAAYVTGHTVYLDGGWLTQ